MLKGLTRLKRFRYVSGKIYINSEQFFEGVPEISWHYRIGCYNVLEKWLKSRKNRKLSGNEIEKFIQIVESVSLTLNCMKEIDKMVFL